MSDLLDIGGNLYQFDVLKGTYGKNAISTICFFENIKLIQIAAYI